MCENVLKLEKLCLKNIKIAALLLGQFYFFNYIKKCHQNDQ